MHNPFYIPPPRLNRTDRRALGLNIALFLGTVLAANGLVFGLGWSQVEHSAEPPSPYNVPGWLVGSIWLLLFIAMATARWRLNRAALHDERALNARWWLGVLVVNCLLYPAYTLGLQSLTLGLLGNLFTIALAGLVARLSWPHDRVAAGLVSAVVVWVSFATYLIVGQLGWLH